MRIRRLNPEEHVQDLGLRQMVFFDIDRKDVRAMMKSPLEHVTDDKIVRIGVFDDTGRLQSALKILPFTMRMNGHNVKMGGIAAVVSRPESRGKGNIRRLFLEAFREMREAGQAFSFLYPFSYEYYRKFGYELSNHRRKILFPLSQLGGFDFPENVRPFEPGHSIEPFAEVYENFIRERNFAIVRGKEEWEKFLDRDNYKNLEFTYLFRSPQGHAEAYILYGRENNGEDEQLVIKECCWTNPHALWGVFGFLSKLSAEYSQVHWNAPCDVNIHALLPGEYNLTWHEETAGMNRLVDVAAALQTLNAPNGSGRVNIGVNDRFLQDNSGVYAVEWEGGRLTAEKSRNNNPELETSAQTLAQLVPGYLSLCEARYKKDTVLRGAFAELDALFPKRRLFMTENF